MLLATWLLGVLASWLLQLQVWPAVNTAYWKRVWHRLQFGSSKTRCDKNNAGVANYLQLVTPLLASV